MSEREPPRLLESPIRTTNGRRVLGKAVATVNTTIRKTNAKLPAGTPRAAELNITSHDLRHHFASVLIAAGESVVAVAEWLGHDNATLVLTT